ncbi:MAG: acetate/propionate family kinase [Gracilibacteraceae bacterium]|nr:acetate/propionate family kinase [Gracilibacteraceae bacterium]
MSILVCNVGSTSLKFKLFVASGRTVPAEGRIERVGSAGDAVFTYSQHLNGISEELTGLSVPDYTTGIELFLRYLTDPVKGAISDIAQVEAIGFKTVAAKGYYGVHELTDEVLTAMAAFNQVAPAHNPPYIAAIQKFRTLLPGKLCVGVFETAFHASIPLERKLYALPYEWYEKYGIQRLGYHGASHNYIARRVQELAGANYRLISCHLGGSGSLCAIENGRSTDTSFGFSPQSGIPHANRAGDLDAYIFPYLQSEGLTPEEIRTGLSQNGGLLGLSGVSGDMRDIEAAAAAGNRRARLAIDVYCSAVTRYIGAFYAELGGLDYLAFTGGIGENSALVRGQICARLEHMGIRLNAERNRNGAGERFISDAGSPVRVLVIPADEEAGIAAAIMQITQGDGSILS